MDECAVCHNTIHHKMSFTTLFKISESFLCSDCEKSLEIVVNGCQMCGKKTNEPICQDCLYWEKREISIKNYSLYHYNSIAKNMINQVKFSGNCKVLNIFVRDIHQFCKKNFRGDYYALPVPLHPKRLSERGFNQSLVLAKMMPFPILDVFEKVTNDKQSKKNRHERLNMNPFRLKTDYNFENKKIIIVDDIYTTGSTIHHIGNIILTNKVQEIVSFTLFRS